MGQHTEISWCDSTANPAMGCDGCELWAPKVGIRHCYAGAMIDGDGSGRPGFAGRKGWPRSFKEVATFPARTAEALRWSDLTGKQRPEKPWLDGLPRLIFWFDLGDLFTESLPLTFASTWLDEVEAAHSPHQHLILTKRPSRLLELARHRPLPPGVWPGVSVTSQATLPRVDSLLKVPLASGAPRWLSAEPALERMSLEPHLATGLISWVIWGGESGPDRRPAFPDWAWAIRDECGKYGVPFFLKQWSHRLPDQRGELPAHLYRGMPARLVPSSRI